MKLTLVKKIILICAVPLLGLIAVSGNLSFERLETKEHSEDIQRYFESLKVVSSLLVSLNQERSLAILSKSDMAEEGQWKNQWSTTDSYWKTLQNALQNKGIPTSHKEVLSQVGTMLSDARLTRTTDQENATILAGYEAISDVLLATYTAVAESNQVQGLSVKVNSLSMLELSREATSRLREHFFLVVYDDQPIFAETVDPLIDLKGTMDFNLSSHALSILQTSRQSIDGFNEKETWQFLQESFKGVMELSEDGGFGIDGEEFLGNMSSILQDQDQVIRAEFGSLDRKISDIDSAATQALWLNVVSLSSLLLVIAVVAFVISKGIKAGMNEIFRTLNEVAKGDLQRNLQPKGSDEISDLLRTTKSMIEQLRVVFKSDSVDWEHMSKMEELEKVARSAQKDAEGLAESAERDKQAAEIAKKQAEDSMMDAEKATKEALLAQRKVESALVEAENEKTKALEATELAQVEKKKAEKAAEQAKEEAEKALKARNEAALATKQAEKAASQAELEKVKAEEEKKKAEQAMLASDEAKKIAERSKQEAEQAAESARREKEKAKLAQTESEEAKAQAEILGKKAKDEADFLMKRANIVLDAVGLAEKGDLTVQIELDGDDPVAKIGRSLSNFFTVLRNSILEIERQAKLLDANNIKLGTLTEDMLQNALATAQRVADMVSASLTLNENMSNVKHNTDEIKLSISDVASSTVKAANLTDETVESSDKARKVVDRLSQRVLDIQNIVSLINQIATQTNLLALNAAIEAARAGDSGRGFSVVANEVKELANQTAIATTEISDQVEEINTEAASTVEVMETISGFIARINDSARSISASAEQQEAASSEIVRIIGRSSDTTSIITENLSMVKKATDSTKIVTESTKGAAMEVKLVSDQLIDLVAKFKVHKDGESDLAA